MERLIATCKFLNEPRLIAKFQRYCGVVPVQLDSASNNVNVDDADDDVADDVDNVRDNKVGRGRDGTLTSNTLRRRRNDNDTVTDDTKSGSHGTQSKGERSHGIRANGSATPTVTGSSKTKAKAKGKAVDSVLADENEDLPTSKERPHLIDSYTQQQNNLRTDNTSKESPSDSTEEEEDDDYDKGNGYVINNVFLFYLFHFGASIGNEIFYIIFFPFWFWNIDGYVGRRICVFWCIFMYLGQITKDIVRWPRPSVPPVFRMEKRYSLEYGMPSTHSMVGAGLPFTILLLTMNRYVYPFEIGLVVAILWCVLVGLSRLYLGMHSILDVLVGLLYVFILMAIFVPMLDRIDDYLLHDPYAPIVAVCVPLALALAYPMPPHWTQSPGDTTLILGVSAGVAVGNWIAVRWGMMHAPSTSPPYPIIAPSLSWLGEVILRLCLGSVMLFSTRAVVGAAVRRVACAVVGVDPADKLATRHRAVELPYKFVTYAVLSFNTVFLAPQVFRYLRIERETYFTEM